ncbi:hypothetical protein BKA81DRAFT_365867 [Phyllosticta paracitricarpa]
MNHSTHNKHTEKPTHLLPPSPRTNGHESGKIGFLSSQHTQKKKGNKRSFYLCLLDTAAATARFRLVGK